MIAFTPAQQTVWDDIVKIYASQRLAHGLLLVGGAENARLDFAKSLASLLLCEDPIQPLTACGKCVSCELFHANSHPDFLEIQPENGSTVLKIDQIREIQPHLAQSPHRAKAKVILINPAEKLNNFAANALLKCLEEPLSDRYLILSSTYPSLLPATIRSRIQMIAFRESPADMGTIEFVSTSGSDAQQKLWKETLSWLEMRSSISWNTLAQSWVNEDCLFFINAIIHWGYREIRNLGGVDSDQLSSDFRKLAIENNYINNFKLIIKIYEFIDKLIIEKNKLLSSVALNKLLLLENIFISWSRLRAIG